MDLQAYGGRLLNFMSSLPQSSVSLIYFRRKSVPFIHDRLKTITLPSGQHYVSTGPSGRWVYVYTKSDVKYLIYRNHTDVLGIIAKEDLDHIEGGARFQMAGIGDHVTIGVEEHNGQFNLTTHRTNYQEQFDPKYGYVFRAKRSTDYDIPLHSQFRKDQPLITNQNVSKGTIGSAYANFPAYLEAIEAVHNIYQGIFLHTGGSHHIYHGKRYKIRSGNRGGKYIQVKDKKIYLTKLAQEGGTLTDDIFKFLYDRLISHIMNHFEDEFYDVEPKIIYDDDEGNHFVLCYDLPEIGHRQVFYLNIKEITADYTVYIQRNQASENIEAKYQEMVHAHKQALAAA